MQWTEQNPTQRLICGFLSRLKSRLHIMLSSRSYARSKWLNTCVLICGPYSQSAHQYLTAPSPPINRHLWRSGGARQVGLADAGGRAGPTDRRDRPAGPLTITAFIRRGAGRALRAGVSAQQVGSRRVPSKKRACYDEVTWSIPVATWTDMERTQRCLPPPAIERRQTSHRWRTARAPSAA